MGFFQSPTYVRHVLILIWWISFTANLAIVIYLYARGEFELDDLLPAVKTLNMLYVPYLGIITAFYWGKRGNSGDEPLESRAGNLLAVACSLLWNGIVLFLMVRLLMLVGTIEESLEVAEKLGGIFVWLVAPALGYYFATFGSSTK